MDKTHSPLFCLLASLFFFFSCTKNTETQSEFSTSVNADGVIVASNPEFIALQNADKPHVTFNPLRSIQIEETSGLLLGSVTAVETDEEGAIYFLDSRESKLIALNQDGSL